MEIDTTDFHKIHFQRRVKDYTGRTSIELIIQYCKIIIRPFASKGSMLMFSLQDRNLLQFKGMHSYSLDFYHLKQDIDKNWMLLNTTKYAKALKLANGVSGKAYEKDYIIKLLSPLEALAVNRILDELQKADVCSS